LLRRFRPLAATVAILSIAAFIGWLKAAPQETALSHFAGLSLGLLTMAALREWCCTPERLLVAAVAAVLPGLGAVSLGVFSASIPAPTKYLTTEYLPQIPLHLPNLEAGGLVNPNALGIMALIVLPLAIALMWPGPEQFRWRTGVRSLGGVTALCALAVLVVTQSRSAWSAALLTLLIALMFGGKRTRWRWAAIAVVIVVPVCVVLWFRAHLDPTVATATERMSHRAELWREGLLQLRGSPVFGIGMNAFRHIATTERGTPHVHNIFLQTALDCGLVGLCGYVTLIGLVLVHARGFRGVTCFYARRILSGAALSVVAVHIFGLADAVTLGAKIGIFQWWAAGLVLSAPALSGPRSPARRVE
jgi:hypothetical protein